MRAKETEDEKDAANNRDCREIHIFTDEDESEQNIPAGGAADEGENEDQRTDKESV